MKTPLFLPYDYVSIYVPSLQPTINWASKFQSYSPFFDFEEMKLPTMIINKIIYQIRTMT